MPLNFLYSVAKEGRSAIPYYDKLKIWVPVLGVVFLVKNYFAGASNTWDRDMHGRVVIITGGTSGLGAQIVRDLANKGAQIVLLVRNTHNSWISDYIDDLREETANPCIYAEEADLADFYSVRKFATKWIDNSPPRRLDMVICCAAVATPPGVERQASVDGLEQMFQVNYLGHYHLLTILAPALRSQPPDRDVRVILTNCIASLSGTLDMDDLDGSKSVYNKIQSFRPLGASKLALSLFGYELQRRFATFQRKDQAPNNVHTAIVDPGMMRSPSFKRFFSCGSLIGLLIYVVLWPFWWLFLKSSKDGAESMKHAMMSPEVAAHQDACYISESHIRAPPPRHEFKDLEFQKTLFEKTEKLISAAEKATLIERKTREKREQSQGSDSKQTASQATNKPDAAKPAAKNKKAKRKV